MIDLESLLHRLPAETAKTLVEQARITTPDLADHLYRQLVEGRAGNQGVMAPPVLEGAYPWLPHANGWNAALNVFGEQTVNLLKEVSFPPYQHQVEAWSILRDSSPKSVIVSSGTGSGKTECFLAPIIDHLVSISDNGKSKLSGVRAIMLYPLNALINSQEERLSKWLSPFNGNLRYCLYNGATPNQLKSANITSGREKVGDRSSLRADPPPVLVTNITMLEYMLVRREDAPILNRSRGKLDYIILDEAHTYVGAQAAELSLLLRRVVAAFGRNPCDIRFVATSATMGDGDTEGLRQFLADLAGVPTTQVHVVQGKRAPLGLSGKDSKPISVETLKTDPISTLSPKLFRNIHLSAARRKLCADHPYSWGDWKSATASIIGQASASDDDATLLLSRCIESKAPDTGELLLPCRLHFFHKTMPGVWVCPNEACLGRPRDMPHWKYGAVSVDDIEHCSDCGSVMFEWVTCRSCGDGALMASESHSADRLVKPVRGSEAEDFLQALNDDESDDDDVASEEISDSTPSLLRYLLNGRTDGIEILIDRTSGKLLDIADETAISLRAIDSLDECPHCHENRGHGPEDKALSSIVAGAPYLVRQLVPTVLPLLTARSETTGLPLGGRSMLTFTDARQGTARHSATLQISAEREFVRGFLYHSVNGVNEGNAEALEKLRKRLKKFQASVDDFDEDIAETEQEIEKLSGGASSKSIEAIISELAGNSDVRGTISDLWSARTESLDSPEALAEFLLLRELARRPKWAASGETLGLFRVVLPPKARILPTRAASLNISNDDWESLLELCVTHFLRQNQMLLVRRPNWLRYAGIKGGGRFVVRDQRDVSDKNIQKAWPSAHAGQPQRTAIISLLSQCLGLPLDERESRDLLDDVLKAAFRAIQASGVLSSEADGSRLDWTKLHLAPVMRAAICPVTRLPLQAAFKGMTIYRSGDGTHLPVTQAQYPNLPFPNRRAADGSAVTAEEFDRWLSSDPIIEALRSEHLWDNRTDRAVRFEGYYRSAEHSAQISQSDLQAFEADFKVGKINILNCSTTMEMGVDIGEVEAVLLTNAPPAISNYKQRVGRAGRRNQSLSLGITICMDRPLDRLVAENPIAYLTSKPPVPRVSLESALIVQRHVNAWTLSKFLSETDMQALKLTVGGFFGFAEKVDLAPFEKFISWIDKNLELLSQSSELAALVFQTPLPASALPIEDARESIYAIGKSLSAEWEALGGRAGASSDTALARAQSAQRSRLEKEYLLSALSGQNFLPAYGFPTDVVQFWTETSEERKRKEFESGPTSYEDRRFISRGMPSRQRSVAIHEYAPGSEIVIDGLHRKSAGVTLNWQRPVSNEDVREVQSLRTIRFCESCGALRSSPSIVEDQGCPSCGSLKKQEYHYLSPAGFTVDTRAKVSDQSDGTAYVPRPQAIVGAMSGEWRSLPDPSLGQFRTSADGLVFERSDGPFGFGYAICLECGRAEPETDGGPGPAPKSMVDHRPLRWTPNASQNDTCPGSHQSFSMQRHLRLGDEIRTGVLELQLANVSTNGTAITVALAIREASARLMGIEPTEMGVAAVQTRDRSDNPKWTATLYDRTSGGAGFATQAGEQIVQIVRSAASILDCSKPWACGDKSASRICPKCVLRPDTQSLFKVTDRKSAFEALDHTANKLDLPKEFRIFGADSQYVPEALPDALRLYLERSPGSVLYLRLDGNPETWDLDSWNARALVQRFAARDGEVSIVADQNSVAQSSTETKLKIAMWALRAGARFVPYSEPIWPKGAIAVAATPNATRVWGAAAQSLEPSEDWGRSDSAPLVSTDSLAWDAPDKEIDIPEWLNPDAKTPVMQVKRELDGDIASFGSKFRNLVGSLEPRLSADRGIKISKIRITDRYIYSPLYVRLYGEICKSFGNADTLIEVQTRGAKRYTDQRSPNLFFHDWPSVAVRNAVMQAVLSRSLKATSIEQPKNVPHGRTIELHTDRGEILTILLDQGVGSWRTNQRVEFDFFAPQGIQCDDILQKSFEVSGEALGAYVAVIA